MFFDKSIEHLDPADLQWLVDNDIREDDRLDYKRDMYSRDPKGKHELLRDVTAMANHRGGRLLVGIDEDDEGKARTVVGVPPAGQTDHAMWIQSVCLSGIQERILGLRIKEVRLTDGKVAVVVDVPESPNGPHMVCLDGENRFWMRHGRQKGMMSVEEIRDSILRVLDNQGRIERFLQRREAEILENAEGRCWLALAVLPAYFRAGAAIDTSEVQLREQIRCLAGQVGWGEPYPILEGVRTDNRTLYWDDRDPPPLSDYIEVHRNAYVEFARRIDLHPPLGLYYDAMRETKNLVSFVEFVADVYSHHLPGAPVVVRFRLFNARDMWLLRHGRWTVGEMRRRWQRQHLDLGEFLVQDLAQERQWLPKRICDRLWNAFHYEEAGIFDKDGRLKDR
ncbi:MAG: ATP-binding protein [Chloroflexi bacterium]|nr:ATP-binding protein [Chloroflexota bacterium]